MRGWQRSLRGSALVEGGAHAIEWALLPQGSRSRPSSGSLPACFSAHGYRMYSAMLPSLDPVASRPEAGVPNARHVADSVWYCIRGAGGQECDLKCAEDRERVVVPWS